MSFYNEEPYEIRRTLVSLADQVKEIDPIAICHVVMVSDGHSQMHPDTKKYLKALFCNKSSEEDEFDQIYGSLG
jgi:hypothetical protein